jgi:small-conductance mechanosensitive channel
MSIYGATDRPMYTLRRLVTLFWFIAGYQLLATAVTILLPESDARRIIRRVLLPLLAALGVLHLVGLLAALWAWASQPLITFAADTLTAADLGVAAAIMATFWLAGLLARELMVRHVVPRTETDPGLARTVAGFMQFGIILAGLWIAIASLGLQLSNLTILISALTVGIGFGLQDVIKNIMGGLILLVEGHVKPNDIIKVNDQSGRVEAIGIRSTTVRAWDGSQVIVPNADLISEKVYDQTELLRIEIEVNVSTEINPREVEAVLRQIAAQHPAVVADPAPSVLFSAFGANTFDLTLYCFVGDRADRVDTESDLRYAIVETFRAQGIEMPTPQYEVHLMQAG